jgi:phosphoserine aminotransferase
MFSPDAAYCHFTSNNTIFGTQFRAEPPCPQGVALVCDASSDIFSRPIDVSKYALIYAGAQKNLGPAGCALVIIRDDMIERGSEKIPTMMQYRIHAAEDSRYNTPNSFAIYLMGRVFKWILGNGGLEGMETLNERKASALYDTIDASPFYRATVTDPGSRSRMNVCFRCVREDLEPKFLGGAERAGLKNLKGHRSVGGMRASIYNAVSLGSVNALVEFMKEFERANGERVVPGN